MAAAGVPTLAGVRLRSPVQAAAGAYRDLSPAAYRRITLVTLVSLVAIMVTGAAVRLTDSGMGCSTWPSCEPDSFTPHSASDLNGMVEFVNRLITGAVMLFTLVAVVGAHRMRASDRGSRQDLWRWSLGLPVWVLGNAVVGGLVVVLHLDPVSVIGHFLVSLGAVWNAVVLHQRAAERPEVVAGGPGDPGDSDDPGSGDPGGPAVASTARRPLAVGTVVSACRLLVVAAALVIVSGTIVTGSGPHAGDAEADRLDFVVGEVARLHGVAMVLFLVLTLSVLWMARRGDAAPSVERRLRELLVVLVAQAAVGYTQYFTGVPAFLVGVHVLGAALVWVAVVRVVLALSEPATSAGSVAPARPAVVSAPA
jgi:cytochrome c oxidase assembly protein subunit 15